jgi:RNA polymerase sigma-B factor
MRIADKPNQRLTEEEIQSLLTKYAEHGDASARDTIVMQYTNLVESIARKFVGSGEQIEDLIQEGFIGLINAVDLFDPSKGVKFSTYATHFIIGQIKHYLRDKGKIIKEPAWLQELNQRMSKVIESLTQQYGRPPSEDEIAHVMDLPEETVSELLMTREVFKVSSLDAVTTHEDNNGYTVDTEKIKEKKAVSFQLPTEDKIVLETAMDRLKSIEQQVIYEFFFLDLNQTEIANKLGISCNYVSHILRNSTKKLRRILQTEEIQDAQLQAARLAKTGYANDYDINRIEVVDRLTGVYNKHYFMLRLDEEINRSIRHNHPLSVIMIRVEMPETIHKLAKLIRFDDVMIASAGKIKSSVRKTDILARYDEDVFGLILPRTGEYVQTIAKRIETAMAAPIQIQSGNERMAVIVHTAFATYPNQAKSCDELLAKTTSAIGIIENQEVMPEAA